MNKFLGIVFICVLAVVVGQAQPLNKSTYNTMIKIAEEKAAMNDHYNALEWYEKAYNERKDYDLAAIIGDMHYKLRDYKKAVSWYKRAVRKNKEGQYDTYLFPYARALKMNGDYKESIEAFNDFLAINKDDNMAELSRQEIKGAEMAMKKIPSADGLTITNAGKKINSKTSEYSPVLSKDGNKLFYASLLKDDIVVVDGSDQDYYAKIVMSTKGEDGWEEAVPLDENINRPGFHVGNVTLSPDNRLLFFTRQTLEGNVLKDSKLFYATGNGGTTWSAAKEVTGINGDYIVKHPMFGELYGNEVLFFVSDMPGGEGGFDIFYATRKGEGVYGDPVNLGAKINTLGDEETPFYRDGTLYFSSTGHAGLGGLDLFYATWNGVVWSKPENMGEGYNTSADDRFFSLDKEGYKGMLTSNRINEGSKSVNGKTCCDDIYNVNLKKIEADLVVTVIDAETKKPLPGVTVKLMQMVDNNPKQADSKTNVNPLPFNFGLDLDMPYKIIAEAPDYFGDTLVFNTVGLADSKTYTYQLALKPQPVYVTLSREEPILLENILYDFNDDKILPAAEPDLNLILELMTEYADMTIELSSHTDARGNDASNRDLSQRRAESARRWLIAKGVERRRIQTVGYGESKPKVVNEKINAAHPYLKVGTELTEAFINTLATEEQKEAAHQVNRRTEFRIVSGPTSIKFEEKRLIRKGVNEVKEDGKVAPTPTPEKKKN